jgi:hypothetical protein
LNKAAVATATEEEDSPEVALPGMEQSQPEHQKPPNSTNAEATAEEEPLESYEPGWGNHCSFNFTNRGNATLNQLHSTRRGYL